MRSRHFICSRRLQNTFLYKTTSEKIPRNIPMSLVQENLVDMGTSEMLTKEAISLIQKDKKEGFLSKLLLNGKRDEGLLLSHHSEGTKQTYSVPTPQNGRFTLPEIHAATRRLHVQALLKRCLLFRLIEQRIRVNDTLSMIR